MQQYVYGNIGSAGYAYQCSDRGYFNKERTDALKELIYYDVNVQRTGLAVTDHLCYWMVTTNLGIPTEPERLFLQATGGFPGRSANYAHGYISQDGETDLLGPRLLQLLQTEFWRLDQMERAVAEGKLRALSPEELPREMLKPAPISKDILRTVLLSLLKEKKVILKIRAVGAEAMKESRELLMSIYQRLPYELRRRNGFVTGITEGKILEINSPLPPTVGIMLMDGDAGVSALRSGMGRVFVDLTNPDPLAGVPNDLKAPSGSRLLEFLLKESPDKLDEFFAFSRSLTSSAREKVTPGLAEYEIFYDFFCSEALETDADQICLWAASLYTGRLSKNAKEGLYGHVAAVLEPEQLIGYLCSRIHGLADLPEFGIPDKNEVFAINGGHSEKGKVADIHCALTMQMASLLASFYPQDFRKTLIERLTQRFLKVIRLEYPELDALKPTAEQIVTLGKLPRLQETDRTLSGTVRAEVGKALDTMGAEVCQKYQQELDFQRKAGLEAIAQWPDRRYGAAGRKTQVLDQTLRQNYLYSELIREPEGWRQTICRRMGEVFPQIPLSLEDYQAAADEAADYLDYAARIGGSFSIPHSEMLKNAVTLNTRITELRTVRCRSLDELLGQLKSVDSLKLCSVVSAQVKQSLFDESRLQDDFTRAVALADELCALGVKSEERPMLVGLLRKIPSAGVSPETMDASQAFAWIRGAGKLQKGNLFSGPVNFRPWHLTDDCEVIEKELMLLQNYGSGGAEPKIYNGFEMQWVMDQMRGQIALQYLLVRRYPDQTRQLLPLLAEKLEEVTPDMLRLLYVMGWPREKLEAGAGEATSPQWKAAAAAIFPAWPEYPAAEVRKPDHSAGAMKAMKIIQPILLGVAGLIPASVLLAMGGTPLLYSVVSAAAVFAFLLSCLTASFCVKDGLKKSILRLMTLALIPGTLASLALMIFRLIMNNTQL